MQGELLSVRSLSMKFGGVAALKNVNVSIAPKELCCIIGPNGAGKSTFFKCVTGQISPTSGAILYQQESLVNQEPHTIARRGIGIKTQIPNVLDGLTVEENILMALRQRFPRTELADRLDAISHRLGVHRFMYEAVGTLAHGQRQLVELAMVLGQEPTLVLLDEPAAGLSKVESDHLANIVTSLSSHCAAIVVEHDLDFIRAIANRIVVFNQGEVLMDGHAEAVLNDNRVKDVYLGKQEL